MSAEVVFDPSSHTYHVGGRRVPSVTQIVEAVLPRKWNADPWCMMRGSMVHRAVALLVRGTLDESSVDERIRGQVEAARKAIAELAIDLRDCSVEVPMASGLGFAGTPDLVTSAGLIVDWKSSLEPQVEIQLGGYAVMVGRSTGFVLGVELREDGTYRAETYQARRCQGLWLNVLSVYQWKQRAGV
jgi:hypothetical protein